MIGQHHYLADCAEHEEHEDTRETAMPMVPDDERADRLSNYQYSLKIIELYFISLFGSAL